MPSSKLLERSPLTALEPMKDASEDEQEEDVAALSKSGSSQRKSRSKREAELLKLMNDDGT